MRTIPITTMSRRRLSRMLLSDVCDILLYPRGYFPGPLFDVLSHADLDQDRCRVNGPDPGERSLDRLGALTARKPAGEFPAKFAALLPVWRLLSAPDHFPPLAAGLVDEEVLVRGMGRCRLFRAVGGFLDEHPGPGAGRPVNAHEDRSPRGVCRGGPLVERECLVLLAGDDHLQPPGLPEDFTDCQSKLEVEGFFDHRSRLEPGIPAAVAGVQDDRGRLLLRPRCCRRPLHD